MTVEILIRVPDDLSHELQQMHNRLPEVLARGLRGIQSDAHATVHDEQAIFDMLISQPIPAQILALRPSDELQGRVSELLQRKKQGTATMHELIELERYLLLEYLVRNEQLCSSRPTTACYQMGTGAL